MSEPLGAFLGRLEQSGRVVPFELALRHQREQEVASLPPPDVGPASTGGVPRLRAELRASLLRGDLALPPREPMVTAAPVPVTVPAPNLAGNFVPGVLYGSSAGLSPDGSLQYIDTANFGWLPTGQVETVVPASGVTVAMEGDLLYVKNAAELAALTIRLPAGPMPGQLAEVGFAHPVTVLSIGDAAGSAVAGAPADAYGPGNALQFRYIGTVGWVFWK